MASLDGHFALRESLIRVWHQKPAIKPTRSYKDQFMLSLWCFFRIFSLFFCPSSPHLGFARVDEAHLYLLAVFARPRSDSQPGNSLTSRQCGSTCVVRNEKFQETDLVWAEGPSKAEHDREVLGVEWEVLQLQFFPKLTMDEPHKSPGLFVILCRKFVILRLR